jgi:hypothetical protein
MLLIRGARGALRVAALLLVLLLLEIATTPASRLLAGSGGFGWD